ncbi:uncharacterized protein G2W53_015798 [Senna tora]|uniref:Uncharacterized protein n=1 Tax=Senna tora TaxID=362788 RepID=A0A834WVG6_9FABA|nr:uncharacterized protein G2W53_015798 [Senna tora]
MARDLSHSLDEVINIAMLTGKCDYYGIKIFL